MLNSIKKNYFLLISIFLIIYFFFNLLSGERGLISYYEKKQILKDLKIKESSLINQINDLDFKNSLLSDNLDLDYIETLIRERLLFGKKMKKFTLLNKMTQKIRPRHPEKVKNPINPIKKKPDWIRSKLNNSKEFFLTKTIVNQNNLVTVCQEANCPNITECWSKRHATFMIMGDTCTRACAFCDVKTGKPGKLDELEPVKISQAVKKLNLKHVVITSVDRDDLDDGGANHFYQVINQIRKINPNTTIEVLTPDFLRKGDAYKKVLEAKPDVFNHNIETVPSLYLKVRPGSRYFASLELLKNAKKMNKKVFTKSGIMVGLGETKDEILQVMDDLKSADVDFLTVGQYLQPSVKHFPLDRYYKPQEFKELGDIAKAKGFLLVSSSPLTRSSYHADEDFAKLQKNRANNH